METVTTSPSTPGSARACGQICETCGSFVTGPFGKHADDHIIALRGRGPLVMTWNGVDQFIRDAA